MNTDTVLIPTVHIWHARFDWLTDKYNTFEATLAADERLRAARYIAQQMRDRFVLARGMLRAVLASYLNAIPDALRLAYGMKGKPFLPGSDIRFNLSHADGLIVLAITRGVEIGVDVENVRPIPEMKTMVRDNFSLSEQAALWSLPAVEQSDAFFRIWTRKEAYVKALGDGYMSFGQFDVNHENPPRIIRVEQDDPARWSLAQLDLGPDYAGAVCIEGQNPRLETHNFLELST